MSRKGKVLESSPVNWMHWSMELMCSRKLLLFAVLLNTKVSSIYLFHRLWGWGNLLRSLASKSSMYKLATMGLISESMVAPSSSSQYLSWNRKCVFFKQKLLSPNRQMMLLTVLVVLCWSSLSCSRCFLMMLMAGSMGTDVNSTFTSYDMMYSSCCSWMHFICCMKSQVFWTLCGDFPTKGFRIVASSFDVS